MPRYRFGTVWTRLWNLSPNPRSSSAFWWRAGPRSAAASTACMVACFFLGILLGIVFVFAAVLIMYYKQISEGYEDQSRFEIMQKVGMTKKEIRKSVNSQVLTVFFLPLLAAGGPSGLCLPPHLPVVDSLQPDQPPLADTGDGVRLSGVCPVLCIGLPHYFRGLLPHCQRDSQRGIIEKREI